MAIGIAQFGSGLLSVTLCRPSMNELGVRVIIGRCDHRMHNAYYEGSLDESDMTLVKDTAVNVRVQCTALGYDSDVALPSSYRDIADLNNDPVVYGDPLDLSTMQGDSVRYFIISGALPDTEYDLDISTDAVSDSSGGRLNAMTLTGRTLGRNDARGGVLSCHKNSYYDTGESFSPLVNGSFFLWEWDQGSGDPLYTYGTPTAWTVTGATALGVITYTGTGHPEDGAAVGLTSSTGSPTPIDVVYVTALDTGAGTFTAVDARGAVIDFVADVTGVGAMFTVGDEPPKGMSGLHCKRILDTDPQFYAGVDDNIYVSRWQANLYMPLRNTADSRGQAVRRILGNTTALESMSLDRDTATADELAIPTLARFYFLQPWVLETQQQAAGCFIRGDWDLTLGNDFSHWPQQASITTPWTTWTGLISENFNPILDASFTARMTEMVTSWRNGTDMWNLYFAGGNPPSFLSNKANLTYPPLLTMDSSGDSTVDPVSAYGADPIHYYNRAFVIETERHCIVCPDSMSHRGGRFGDLSNTGIFFSDFYPRQAGVIFGGEHVFGPYQEQEIYKKVSSVAGHKAIGFINKGMVILGSYDITEVNPDSSVRSAVDESARLSTFMQSVGGGLVMVGDRHVTPIERAAGKGRAEENGFIQQIISGAHQKAQGSRTFHDYSLGLINGSSNSLNYQTHLVTGEVLHNDTMQVNTMARRTSKASIMFGEIGPNNVYMSIGRNDLAQLSGLGPSSGFPIILDQSSDGAQLLTIEGFFERPTTNGLAVQRWIYFDTKNSSGMAHDTTVDDPLPFDTVITITSPINVNTFSVGADMSAYDKVAIDGPVEDTARFEANAETSLEIIPLTSMRYMGKSTSVGANTMGDTSKPIDFDAAELGIVAGDRLLYHEGQDNLSLSEEFEITGVTDADNLAIVGTPTSAVRGYFIFEKNYCFTCSGTSLTTQLTVASGDADFNDAAFLAAVATGDLVVVNLVTGTTALINSAGPDDANWTATTLVFAVNVAEVFFYSKGKRAGADNITFEAGDVCVILPLLTVSVSFTDATESGGGGNTTVARTIDRVIERT